VGSAAARSDENVFFFFFILQRRTSAFIMADRVTRLCEFSPLVLTLGSFLQLQK
jgi:hypothetical protein